VNVDADTAGIQASLNDTVASRGPQKPFNFTFTTRSFDSNMGQGQSQQPVEPEPQLSEEERAQIQAEVRQYSFQGNSMH
jgi:hypothetical protein